MKFLTTKQAFTEMIHERGIHHELGITSEQVRNHRRRLSRGELSLELMEALLAQAGYLQCSETTWSATKITDKDQLKQKFVKASYLSPTDWDPEMKAFIEAVFQ